MKVSPGARLLLALPVLAALLGVIGKEALLGWADYNGREARYWLDQAIVARKPMDDATWSRTRVLLEASLALDPDNAMFTEDLANLHFLRAASVPASSPQGAAEYELALHQYLRAAYLRPTSAYTHASIATVKLRLGQFDPDFSAALLLASRYGPWEPSVQQQVLAAGFRTWAGLQDPARAAVRGTLRRAYQLDPKRTMSLLASQGSMVPSCGQLQVQIPEICPST